MEIVSAAPRDLLARTGGFVGEHDRDPGMPIPDHIDARHVDVPDLLNGMITFANDHAHQLAPVVAAAMLAFGFVNAHPFEDGDYSARLLPVIEWRTTERGNVEVLNDTADFYRYCDATPHAEFLYECARHRDTLTIVPPFMVIMAKLPA